MELHERLEGAAGHPEKKVVHAVFWQVIAQIVVLDAVFSLDSVITAVGMVDHLSAMMIAVIIAIAVMMIEAANQVGRRNRERAVTSATAVMVWTASPLDRLAGYRGRP